ncbi:hypothetical protein HK100_011712, partial [Physocladia obscura]
YTRNFYRAAWILTALDAGFLTAHTIKPKIARDFCSIVFTVFYLFNFDKADAKLHKYHASITVDMLRASWNKQLNPFLRLSAVADTGILGIRKNIIIHRQTNPPSPTAFHSTDPQPLPPIEARLYYSGTEKSLVKNADSLIFMVPGGGFAAMPPLAHEDYTSIWARRTKVPIVSVNYDKCPERPYPWALEQCFDAYRAIVETNGECVGMEGWFSGTTKIKKKPIKIVMVGDSAGGNLVAAVVLKILDGSTGIDLRLPNGLVINYPAFTFDPSCWLPNQHRQLFRSASSVSAPMSSFVHTRATIKPENPFAMPPAPRSIDVLHDKVDRSDAWYRRVWELIWGKMTTSPRIPSALTMSSHFSYFTDLIMPPEILRAISLLLLGTSPVPIRFDEDYLLCPIVAPEELLARFPKVHFFCGEKDPFVDDVIVLGEKIRQAKIKAQREWKKMNELREYHAQTAPDGRRFTSHDEEVLSMDKGKPPRTTGSGGRGGQLGRHGMNDQEFKNHIFHHDPSAMVQTKILEGVSHGFLLMLAILPEARPSVHLCADWMTDMLEDEELGSSMLNPGSFTDLETAVEGVVVESSVQGATKVKTGTSKAATTAERLKHGVVQADSVLERRRNRFAESQGMNLGREG